MPYPRRSPQRDEAFGASLEDLRHTVVSRQSGYIRFVDLGVLNSLAKSYLFEVGAKGGALHPCRRGVAANNTRRAHLRGPRASASGCDRIRPNSHDAAGHRVRHRANRRHCPACDFPGGQRSDDRWIDFEGLLDLAFEQIRHYSVSDAAVSLRLIRALGDISSTTSDPVIRRRLLDRGKRVIESCAGQIQEFDLVRLRARLARLESGLA